MLTYGTALLVALGIGFHSLGEGVEIGSLIAYSYAVAGASSNLIIAIGGLGSGVAYLMHKLLEGFVIGVFAAAVKARLGRNLVLGLLAGIPTMIGLTVALMVPVDSTVFFAAGAAAVIYIEYKLIPNLTREPCSILPCIIPSWFLSDVFSRPIPFLYFHFLVMAEPLALSNQVDW